MSTNWKKIIGAVAPGLATVLGGPLAGGAVAVLAEKILGTEATGDPVQDEARIAGIVSHGVTPELRAKIIEADKEVQLALINAGLERQRIEADSDKTVIADVADARRAGASNSSEVFTLGMCILAAWALLTGGTLWGLFLVLTGRIELDIAIVATVFTVVGSVVGYVSNIAQQVVGYFFGSSRGSKGKDEALADAISRAGASAGVRYAADGQRMQQP